MIDMNGRRTPYMPRKIAVASILPDWGMQKFYDNGSKDSVSSSIYAVYYMVEDW